MVLRREGWTRLRGQQLRRAAAEPGAEGAQIPGESWSSSAAERDGSRCEHGGNSGAALERVVLDDGTRLIAKRVGPGADWLGRVTRDRGRTALLWQAGAFERMPAELDHGIESVIADGDGWWVVMRDLSATFLGEERRLSRSESPPHSRRRSRDARRVRRRRSRWRRAPEDRLGMSSPRVAESERAGPDLLPKQLDAAWDAFADSVPPTWQMR